MQNKVKIEKLERQLRCFVSFYCGFWALRHSSASCTGISCLCVAVALWTHTVPVSFTSVRAQLKPKRKNSCNSWASWFPFPPLSITHHKKIFLKSPWSYFSLILVPSGKKTWQSNKQNTIYKCRIFQYTSLNSILQYYWIKEESFCATWFPFQFQPTRIYCSDIMKWHCRIKQSNNEGRFCFIQKGQCNIKWLEVGFTFSNLPAKQDKNSGKIKELGINPVSENVTFFPNMKVLQAEKKRIWKK